MRHLITLILVFASVVCVADTKLPKKIDNVFSSKYAGAQNMTFTATDNDYQISFQLEGLDKVAIISKTGEWKRTTTSLGDEMIPQCIYTAVSEKYYDYEVSDALLIETPGTTAYEITIKVTTEEYDEEKDEDIMTRESFMMKFDDQCNLQTEE